MGQVTKGFSHVPTSIQFDAAGVLAFPSSTIQANQAITAIQAAISLPCSCKVYGVSVYNSLGAANNPTAFDIRYDSTAFVAIPAASATQIDGESDLGLFQTYPPVNATVVINNPSGGQTSVVYQPLAVAGNSILNPLTNAGQAIVTTAGPATQTFATAPIDLILQKGHTLLLSYVSGATVAGIIAVSLFYKPYHLRPGDKPLGFGTDIVLAYADVL